MLQNCNTILMKKKLIILILFALSLHSCNFWKKKDTSETEVVETKKRFEPNTSKRVDQADGGLLFRGDKGSKFGEKNVMWRAALNVLDFIPLSTASYNGGIIVTDWYGNNDKDKIKITINFLSSDVSLSSVKVTSYKKVCSNLSCETKPTDQTFNDKIKQKIFEEVKKLEINKVSKQN